MRNNINYRNIIRYLLKYYDGAYKLKRLTCTDCFIYYYAFLRSNNIIVTPIVPS